MPLSCSLQLTGHPINTFEFLRPLLQSLDYDVPKLSLTVPQALIFGKIFWVLYSLMYPWLNRKWLPQPLILPAEIYKVPHINLLICFRLFIHQVGLVAIYAHHFLSPMFKFHGKVLCSYAFLLDI